MRTSLSLSGPQGVYNTGVPLYVFNQFCGFAWVHVGISLQLHIAVYTVVVLLGYGLKLCIYGGSALVVSG